MYNFLGDGMWEFKVSSLRLTYYDADGMGNNSTTQSVVNDAWDGSRQHEMPEDFAAEGIVRLGHYFGKPREVHRTPGEDLAESFRVREEDFAHDRS